jgi:hypothetical protein
LVFDRNHPPARRYLAGLTLLAAMAASGHALAQIATSPSVRAAPAETVQPGHRVIPSTGVIVPRSTVDPGMKVKAPAMPAQSTPVIHPDQTPPRDGSMVVPR